MLGENTIEETGGFHGFDSPVDALNYYYETELCGRHPDGFEYRQEKALLEWLAERDVESATQP